MVESKVQISLVATAKKLEVGVKYELEENRMRTKMKTPKLGEFEWTVGNLSPRPSPNVQHLMPAKTAEGPEQNEYDRIYVTNRIQIE